MTCKLVQIMVVWSFTESPHSSKAWLPWAILVSCKKKIVVISTTFSDLLKVLKLFVDLAKLKLSGDLEWYIVKTLTDITHLF